MVRGLFDIQRSFYFRVQVSCFSLSVSPIIKKGLDITPFMCYITYVGYAYEYIFINPLRSMG
jgi:hypothetical protein